MLLFIYGEKRINKTRNKRQDTLNEKGYLSIKVFFYSLFFVMQIAFLLLTFLYFAENFVWIYVVSVGLSILTSFRILLHSKKSHY